MTNETKKVLNNLRKKLDNLYFDQVNMASRLPNYFLKPWPNFDLFKDAIEVIPPSNRLAYELFVLNKTLNIKDIEKILTIDEIDELIKIELLKQHGNLVNMGNLSILSFMGRYFIVSFLNKIFEPIPYEQKKTYINMGFDSYLLAYNLSIPRGSKVLDLCTGSGIQAILASDRADKTIGIEIDDIVAKTATYNLALNDVEDKVEIRVGDLYEPVSDERFDIICSNPPYMPVPNGVNYFLVGNGGPNGLSIINRIIDDLDNHLTIGGKCVITATDLIGNETGPLLEKKLERLSKKNKWSTTLILPYRNPIYHLSSKMADWAKLVNDIDKEKLLFMWNKNFFELGANKVYGHSVCVINKVNNYRFNKIELYKHFKEMPEANFLTERKFFRPL